MLKNKPVSDDSGRAPWGVLVVCPLSLVQQWKNEIIDKIAPEFSPTILVHHGPKRERSAHTIASYDIVLTTYSILVAEYPKTMKPVPPSTVFTKRKKGPLFRIEWFRVVLDEAQAIKNQRSESFAAAVNIRAIHRWVLTGTPIQNSVDDMYSLFVFLRYLIVDSYSEWKERWKKGMESKNALTQQVFFKQFQLVLGPVLLRRAKSDKFSNGDPILPLPQKLIQTVVVEFDADERSFYSLMEKSVMADLKKFTADGAATLDYLHALVLLLRLRQACSHPCLCAWSKSAGFVFTDEQLAAVKETTTFDSLPAAVQARMMGELAPKEEAPIKCPVCFDAIEGTDGVLTNCGK